MDTIQTARPVEPGDIAPNFDLPAASGTRIILDSDAVAGHFTALVFLGGASIDAAAQQLRAFTAAAAQFADFSASVFVIGGEVPTVSLACREVGAALPLLNDAGARVRLAYLGGGEGATTVVLAPNRHVIAVIAGEGDHAAAALAAIAPVAASRRAATLSKPHPPILIVPDVLSRADCQHLMTVFALQGHVWLPPGHNTQPPPHDYKVRIPEYGRRDRIDHFIMNPETAGLIHARFQARLFPEIKKAFQYDVTRYEPYRVACYEGERGGELHGHRDNTLPIVAHRRFAVSVNLNTEDFEGGELRFPEFGAEVYRPETGAAIAFSCSMLHEAMHVTKGRRYVLLAFVGGEH